MNNRQKLTAALQNVSPELQQELNCYLHEIDHDEDFDNGRRYDITDAFDDVVNLRIDETKNTALWREVKQIYLKLGYAVVRDPNSQSFGGHGKKYWFKDNGIEYDCVESWDNWINK